MKTGRRARAEKNMFEKEGIVLGQNRGGIIRYNGNGSILIVGPERSGKTAGNIIPTLFDYPGNIVMLGSHEEEFKITCGYRRKNGSVNHKALDEFKKGEFTLFLYGVKQFTYYISIHKWNMKICNKQVTNFLEDICKDMPYPFPPILIIIDNLPSEELFIFLNKYIPIMKGYRVNFLVIIRSFLQITPFYETAEPFLDLFEYIVSYPEFGNKNGEFLCRQVEFRKKMTRYKNIDKKFPFEKVVKMGPDDIVIYDCNNCLDLIFAGKVSWYNDKRYLRKFKKEEEK